MLALISDPQAWVSLLTLSVMEVVLGIDNLVFVAILAGRLPPERRAFARRLGLFLALFARLGLLASITWIMRLTEPVIAAYGYAFSWRDLILIGGGLFLVWKGTTEIHHRLEEPQSAAGEDSGRSGMSAIIAQIVALDLIFSLDSVITAVGMANHLAIMMAAVVIAVGLMMIAAAPLSRFIGRHPTVKMLALSFLLLIGMTLMADGFGLHVPKGYVYAAMSFSALVELLNLAAARRTRRPA